jgi:hypothetical protein
MALLQQHLGRSHQRIHVPVHCRQQQQQQPL